MISILILVLLRRIKENEQWDDIFFFTYNSDELMGSFNWMWTVNSTWWGVRQIREWKNLISPINKMPKLTINNEMKQYSKEETK